jgi:ClpP class serine protease
VQASPRAYRASGLLAVHPSAFGIDFAVAAVAGEPAPYELRAGGVAVVHVEGPIESGRACWFETYDSIVARVREAMASADASAVVLSVDSPGGSVAGMLDAAAALAAASEASGKALIGHTTGQARSAGYALLCGCDAICASESALVGSVGVLYARLDTAQAEAAMGVTHHIIASGEHKADENPHVAMSESAASELQAAVDTLAGMYASLVESRRPLKLTRDELLVGRSYVAGTDGKALGLIDSACSLDALCAALAADPSVGTILAVQGTNPPEASPMNAETRKALMVALDAATAALKAEEGSDDEKDSKAEGDESGDESEGKAKAEGDEEKPDAKAKAEGEGSEDKPDAKGKAEDDDPPEARASVSDAALSALSAESAKRAQAEARAEQAERDALFASRADLSPELRASLAKVPIAEARAIVGAIKPPDAAPADPRAAFVPSAGQPVQGADAGADGKPTRLTAQADELDRRFGLGTKPELGVRYDPTTGAQTFGPQAPKPVA